MVIVGGGPSGACAAKAMADRGYANVHIYEAYPHPKTLSKTSSKAYVVALSPRGQQGILDATGIDLAREATSADGGGGSARGVVSRAISRHVYNPRTRKTSSGVRNHADTPSVIIPRQALTERLLDAAASESGVSVHYQHRLSGVDFENRIATFEAGERDGDDKKVVEVEYDLLIGADGSRSRVRELMVENKTSLKDFSARTEEDSMEYQVVVLPESPFANTHPEGTVHVWNNKRRNAICLAFPMRNHDSPNGYSMLFAVVFPEGELESFREDGYEAPLTELLPDVFDGPTREAHLKEFEGQLAENRIANGGLCVWPSGLGHAYQDAKGRACGVVLLGDAAHGMWPSLGQGANCALESVAVFVKCLDELEGTTSAGDTNTARDFSWWTRELVRRFHEARFEDAVAAVDLTYGGIGSRESRGRQNAPLSAKLKIVGMLLLHKLTLGIVPMPALLRILMGDKDVSYSQAKKFHFVYEKYICLGALSVCVGALAVGMRGFPTSSGNGPEL